MENSFEKKPKMSPQEKLRMSLEAGTIDKEVFLKKVRDLDQSTLAREQCIANVALLESSEIASQFIGTESESDYYMLLSLSHFHAAQYSAYVGAEGIAAHFEAALDAELKVTEGENDFLPYVAGTVAYMHGELDVLRAERTKVSESRNAAVLEKLIADLELHGTPDYLRASRS